MYENYAIARDRAGLNDFKVSKMTGISPGTFSDWKKGRYNPKIDKLEKIAVILNVSVAYLKGDTDDMSITPSEEMGTVTNVFAYSKTPKVVKHNGYSEIEKELIAAFRELNEIGKDEAIKRVKELSYNPLYIEKNSSASAI